MTLYRFLFRLLRYLQIALAVVSGTLLTSLIEYFATNLWMYGASRFTFGLTRVCMTVANGMVCDLTPVPSDRPKAMGRNFSGVGIGFLLGSAIGGIVASSADAYHFASALNLGLAIISFLWTFNFLPETSTLASQSKTTSPKKNDTSDGDAQASLWSAVRTIFANADLRTLFIFHALVLICNISPQHAYFEFIRTKLELSTPMRGLFLVAIGFTSVAAQSSFSLIIARIGTPRFVTLCILGCAVTTFLAPLGGFLLFAVTTLLGTYFAVVTSPSLSALSNGSPAHMSGTVSGLHESLTNMALMLGGLYVPLVSQLHMYAPFWISSAAIVATLVLLRPRLLFSADIDRKKKQE